jgi:hypothetical protein
MEEATMKLQRYTAAGLIVLAASGPSGEAANGQGTAAAAPRTAAKFDIAGVSLGDSVAAATAALKQRGFTVDVSTGAFSFEDWVRKSQAAAKGQDPMPKLDGIRDLSARKGAEHIYLPVRAFPGGGIIESISYTVPSNGRSPAEMIAAVKARYPKGWQPRPTMFRLCAPGDPDCTRSLPQENYIQFDPGVTTFGIHLFPGRQQELQFRSSFDAELRKRVGQTHTSF